MFTLLSGGQRYLNPLRRGAMAPYVDHTVPRIGDVRFERSGKQLSGPVSGTVDIIVGAVDIPAMAVPHPAWTGFPITPAFVRWRLLGESNHSLTDWRTAYDVRYVLPSLPYFEVYAAGTRQNRPHRRGWYRFFLAQAWDSASLSDGDYSVEVIASDSRGNSVAEVQRLIIRNSS